MGTVNGATVLARSLKQQGVDYMFGVVGFPVFGIAAAAQKEGITYIGMRNEQSASYAAHAAGYLTGRPQACLTVPGPGVIHAFAGLANARENCWPMIHIGGASPTYQDGMGAFQEERQVELASPYCKYAQGIDRVDRIPYYVEQAVRTSIYGRPGPVYLDMPDDIIGGEADEDKIYPAAKVGDPPRPQASPSVGAARSTALKEADVVFLMGARLNWIMHFGLPPRFDRSVRVIQLDISPEEIGTNIPAEVALVGDGKAIVGQLNRALDNRQWFYPAETAWRTTLKEKAQANAEAVQPMIDDESSPMNYYRAYRDIEEWLPEDAIIIGEGANTMDIGRTQMINRAPRNRLDAGTYGTMGVGLGFAVAAAVTNPGRPVVSVQGDSAFGFSGMEIETLIRYKLPVKLIVINNGGIGGGIGPIPDGQPVPPSILTYGARYDGMMEALGGKGFYVEDPADLRGALDEAMAFDGPALINVPIDPRAGRKPQQFGWLTT
jgi:2-hydroxyacyl-CoA lyase 1